MMPGTGFQSSTSAAAKGEWCSPSFCSSWALSEQHGLAYQLQYLLCSPAPFVWLFLIIAEGQGIDEVVNVDKLYWVPTPYVILLGYS